jgi:hypothetical protein
MLERQADASRRGRDYAEDAYSALDYGPGPLRNATAGIINQLAGTHNNIRGEVIDYLDDVRDFASTQGERVRESVALYETTDLEIAEMLDASLYQPERRTAVLQLGRSNNLAPVRAMVTSLEPREPATALKPLTDYHEEFPFQPEWIGTGRARDTIWQVTWIAHKLGLMSRPVDIVADLLDPFTGDWAGLKACGDALANLAEAARDLHANVGWIEQRVDAVWLGNAADACWLRIRELQGSLLLAGMFFPPASLLRVVELVYTLLDLVQLAIEAVWDFNARCELGMLNGPQSRVSMPEVPGPSAGYH